MNSDPPRMGWVGWLFVGSSFLWVASLPVAVSLLAQPDLWKVGAVLSAGAAVLAANAALLAWFRARSNVKGRILWEIASAACLLSLLGVAALAGLGVFFLWGVPPEAVLRLRPAEFFFQPNELAALLPVESLVTLYVVAALAECALGATQICTIVCWFFLPERQRARVWLVVDVLLLASTILVSVTFPLFPNPENQIEVTRAAIRLAVTAVFAFRLLIRLVPRGLALIERFDFRALVAARLLRSKKRGFMAAIGGLSLLAVTVSSCSLATVLSVMGGFRNDLKQKILGNNAHVTVDLEHETFGDWRPTLERIRAVKGVEGASVFLTDEVMVTSATNRAGAILRGVIPGDVANVTVLGRNLQAGKLDYLAHPERLLNLPPGERGQLPPYMPSWRRGADDPPATDEPGDPKPTGAGFKSSPLRDLDLLIGEGAGVGQVRDDLEEFLKPAAPPPEDVLPGLIIGQELARSLRLYVGDEVNVVSPLGELGPTGLMPKSRPFRVAGIFYSGMYEYDMKSIYSTLDEAQQFLNRGDTVSGIDVSVQDAEDASSLVPAIRRAASRPELRVRDWRELNSRLFGALALERLAMFITLGLMIVVAGFGVFGILSLMVEDKGREMAMLRAMGATEAAVAGVFLLDGLLLGAIGAVGGLGIAYVTSFALKHFGFPMNPEVYYIDKLPVHMDGVEFLLVAVACIVICMVATVLPALFASRLRPVDALRHQ